MLKEYVGVFNWYGGNVTLKTVAETPGKAKGNLMHQMSKEVNKSIQIVQSYYKNNPQSYSIK